LRTIPGVTEVGGSNGIPLLSSAANGTFLIMRTVDEYKTFGGGFAVFEQMRNDPVRRGDADFRVVSGDFFAAMGIPRVSGRLFEDRDGPDAPHVAVVSASLVKQKWPNESPI
jgi:hypothetical protein